MQISHCTLYNVPFFCFQFVIFLMGNLLVKSFLCFKHTNTVTTISILSCKFILSISTANKCTQIKLNLPEHAL